jgi:cytochrome P450 PksS
VEPGDIVLLFIGSANRDPEVFADPDTLDVTRTGGRHLTFGGGIHVCLGAPLARLEGEVALEALLRRYPRMELVDAEAHWRPGPLFHGLESLPVDVA